jgi:hypothetical protein
VSEGAYVPPYAVFIRYTGILPFVLNGCEIWSVTLREEHWLRLFENRGLRKTLWHVTEMPQDWRLYSYVLALYPPYNGGQGGTQGGEDSRLQPPKTPKTGFKKQILYILWYQKFYVISPSAEICRWNRLTISTPEFWKINKIKKNKKTGHCDWVTEHVVIFVCI